MGTIYTQLKVFHYKEKIDSLPRENPEIKAPVHIRIKPTNRCNHDCSYCAYRVDSQQLGQDMKIKDSIPRDKMLEIVENLEDMGVQAVTFSGGGEPSCYPHIKETIQKLSETKIKFAMLTNGSLLKGEMAELFALHGTWIRISIDGWDGQSYAEYRDIKDNEFDNVINNIVAFKKYKGKCHLGVSIIIDEKNASHVGYLMAFLMDKGVDSIKLSPCIIGNSDIENNAYHAKIFKTAKEQIQAGIAAKEEKGYTTEIFDYYHYQLDTFKKQYSWCPYIQLLPVIGADQNVYTCHDKAYNLEEGLLGSIKDKSFKDLWLEDKERFFKVDPRRHCNHHCVNHNRNTLIHEYLELDPEHLPFV